MKLLYLAAFVVLVDIPEVLPARYQPKWKKQACEVPASQNSHSHYVCDDNGEVRCLPGWAGDLCDVPRCRAGCDPLQGYCKRPGECRCKLGFYGELCNKCIQLPGCQHGYCNVSFECQCMPGWDGLFCSDPLCRSDCHSTRGYCDMPGECRCRLGWAGETCKQCQVLPGCQHGTCTKPLECKCNPGYTGLLCQIPICAKTCHRDRGYCRKPGECRCRVGWTGDNCSTCHPYPGCKHGSCVRPWECNCKPGWGGMLCDEELTHCEKNPGWCNAGKCTSLPESEGSFSCHCPPGTSRPQCEQIVDDVTNISESMLPPSPSLSLDMMPPELETLLPNGEALPMLPTTTVVKPVPIVQEVVPPIVQQNNVNKNSKVETLQKAMKNKNKPDVLEEEIENEA